MFHGGTNFGFMAGANQFNNKYKPDVTSYDYDAPLTENGKPTAKYFMIRDAIKEFLTEKGQLPFSLEHIPENPPTISERRDIALQEILPWGKMVGLVKKVTTCFVPKTMELYSFPNDEIQSYGYVIYRKSLDNAPPSSKLAMSTYMKDRATVLVDSKVVATFDWKSDNFTLSLPATCAGECFLDIVVENLGRVNYTEKDKQDVLNTQRKGLEGQVTLDGNPLNDWTVIALDFSNAFLSNVKNSDAWQNRGNNDIDNVESGNASLSPALYRAKFDVAEKPADCFVKLDGFTKGVVFVNGFNLGRYWNIGPQRTLYLPGPLLKQGLNEVLVFEEQRAGRNVSLETSPQLE